MDNDRYARGKDKLCKYCIHFRDDIVPRDGCGGCKKFYAYQQEHGDVFLDTIEYHGRMYSYIVGTGMKPQSCPFFTPWSFPKEITKEGVSSNE